MHNSRVRLKWQAGKPACGTIVHSRDPAVCELVGLSGFDCVWLDLEHNPRGEEAAADLVRALRVGGTDCIARPARYEFARAARLLDAGAKGIIYPRCESADEARDLVRWAKFPPLGARGFGGGNGDMGFADYMRWANEQTILIIQIESPEALGRRDEIAAVPGVDALLFGSADYSAACGKPGQFADPELTQAANAVAIAALRAGKRVVAIPNEPADVRKSLEAGASLLLMGADTLYLQLAYAQLRAVFLGAGVECERMVRAQVAGRSDKLSSPTENHQPREVQNEAEPLEIRAGLQGRDDMSGGRRQADDGQASR